MESEVTELSAPQSPSPMEGLEPPPEPVAGDDEEVAVAEHALSGYDIPMEEAVQMSEDEDEAETPVVAVSVVEKRRRGRPPKARGGGRAPVARRKEKEEESVCFICFENGNLVGCNRRGCTKVYHPLCVNRDESYFRSRGRWNCGWHICSDCEKAAHFMCYTCTYSLCKACNRGAKFICIRGNKGFCETCYETVMLIESNEHNAGEKLQDSFIDKTSWHYLFKMYWLELNEKLSLTFNELSAPQTQRKRSTAVAYKDDSSDESYHVNDDQETSSDSSAEQYGRKNSAKKKHRRSSRNAPEEERLIQQVDNGGRTSAADDTKWASKELLEFVAHMKDGDTSPLSQFDVQALILAYIKKNNLRDPRKKSQSICDPMLQKIFQKERVGHFEMLKLLESHFLTKEVSQVITDNTHGRGLDLDSGLMDDEGYSDGAAKFGSDKKRKTRKKVEEREPQTNLDDYAAIDVYNISLMYLRRSLMEDLLDDIDSFSEKVIGSFVRIRIPATDKKQDMYRLVQIVGTHVGAENYKIGKKMTDIRLEILNLDKTEAVTIDTISNQEFSEEECRRLRQSIKCGLINRLTVGQVQEKARVLQAVRVDDCLESEKQRLGNLRDRASEQGRRKQLRECVEKIQLLNTDEERWRRLNDVPEIHADPKMDPEYESTDEEPDDKSQDNFNRSREPFSLRKGQHLFPGNGGHVPSSNWNTAHKSSNTHLEVKKSASVEAAREKVDPFNSVLDRASEYLSPQGKGCGALNDKASEYQSSQGKGWGTPNIEANPVGMDRASGYSPQGQGWAPSSTQANPADMEAGGWKNNNQHTAIPAQSYGVPLETVAATLSTGISLPPINNETEKMWYYQDPSGKIHGPFSMLQLRKWNTTGYFPTELKIWRTHGNQDDYVLLSDALIGKFQKVPEPQHNSFPPQPMNFATPMAIENTNPSWVTSNQIPGNWNPVQNNAIFSGSDTHELGNHARWQNQTVAWSIPRSEVANPMGGSIGPIGWEAPRDVNTWPTQAQAHSGFRPTAPAQSGFTPTAPDYSGFRPSAQDNGVFRPTAPDYSGFRPTAPDHAGFRPTAPDHSGFRPTASAHGGFRPTDPFSENNYQPSAHQGRGGRGGRWNRGPDRGSSWNIPNRSGGLRPNGQGFERRQSNWNSSGQQSYGGPWKAQPANDPFNLSSPTPQPARGGWPNKDETANLGGGISSPKQSGKKQGWGSWSASPSLPDKAKKADGWGSWSPVSSPKREKAEIAEAFDASSTWSCQSNASVVTEGSGASNKNQFLQDECPSPTPLCERQKLPVAHHDEHSPASITIPAPEALSTGANKKATVGPDLAQRIGVSSDRWDTPGGECSLPSPTPTTRSPNPWVSSPSRRDAVTESTQPADSGWDHLVPPQDPIGGTGTANTGWGAKSSKGWGGSSQGSTNVNAGWGRPENDNTANLNMSWEVSAQGNPAQNPCPGNSNKNNWGAPVQQGNDGWVSGHGNQSCWGGGGGNGLGNNRVQPGGGRGPPRLPPRGQGQEPGICKFHESGFCKKGARCNYRHT